MKEIPLWKEALHSLNQSVAILAPDGTILFVNRTWANRAHHFGLAPLWDRPGHNLLHDFKSRDLHHHFIAKQLLEQIPSILDGSSRFFTLEFSTATPQGVKWFLAEITPIAEEEGRPPQGVVITCTDITRLKEQELQMQHALSHIRTLRGMLPICAVCKKIKDENDMWSTIEAYLIKHTHAEFTHDICPECIRILYPKYSSILDPPKEQE
ncbi:PAS domain-containing protein [Paenibacillus macerans]|uniref:PAS domain-containing protein n=1 Tax=Paenibacillus macerans TaxID=44252 RepID=UPI003D31D94E